VLRLGGLLRETSGEKLERLGGLVLRECTQYTA
jgi:hypothetical protein